jgi:hypothetical protein
VLWLPAVASCAACCWGWAGLAHQGGRRGAGRLAAAWGCAWLGWGWGGRRCLCAWLLGKRQISVKAQHSHAVKVKEIRSYYHIEYSIREDHADAGAGGGWWIITAVPRT